MSRVSRIAASTLVSVATALVVAQTHAPSASASAGVAASPLPPHEPVSAAMWWAMLAALVIGTLGQALFAGLETGLYTVNRVRLRVRRASMAAKMRWDVMEAELYDHEKAAEAVVTEANHAALTASMVKVEAFRAWLDAAG